MMAKVKNLLNKLPLQIAITIPFTIQVALAVGMVGYLSYKNGQGAVHNLASQVRSELTARILQQLEETVAKPHIINQLNASSLLQGDINLMTGQGEHQFWQQAKLFPATNFVYCATEADGAFLGVGRSQGGTGDNLQVHVVNAQTNRYFRYYDIDSHGQRARYTGPGDRPYDPRVRPWYIAAKQTGLPTWSEVYLDFETLLPTLTANIPVYEEATQALLGVCATDIILSEELNTFLRSLEISQSGIAFIMEPSGLLIASSTEEPIISGEGEETVLLTADQSENKLIRETAKYLERANLDLNQTQSSQLSFWLDNERYFLQTARFTDGFGLDWTLVLTVPEDDFMQAINDNNKITLSLYLLALLLSGGSGLAIARWVIQPLRELSTSAKEIAQGKWDKPIETDRSDAIGDLARSFSTMAQQLKELFTTLEHRVEARNLELIQLNHELQRLAQIDGLTQIANRRYFDNFLDQEWHRLARDNAPLSLILCDADYFKPYNDTYGHQAGDQCLQALALLFKQSAQRPADLVARYGGEEFAIVLPNTDTAGAIHVAEHIRSTLKALYIPHQASTQGQITVSMGIATVIPQAQDSPQTLVMAADQALYAAKANGRNRYSIAPGWMGYDEPFIFFPGHETD